MRRWTVVGLLLLALALGAVGVAGAQEPPPPYAVDPATLPFDPLPGTGAQTLWGLDPNPGAADDGWRIEVPQNWNGGLLLWAHGYRGTGPELTVDNPALRPFLVAQGWAWAASSYRANGYAVEEGVEDTHELLAIFAEQTGRTPDRVVFHGASMGGHITGAAIERRPDAYDAALPICGVMGDVDLYDYFQDVNLVAQELAGVEATIPPGPDYLTATVPAVQAALGYPGDLTGPGHQFAAAVEQRSGGERPGFDAALDYWSGEQTATAGIPFLFGVYGGALSGGQTDPRVDAATTNQGTVYQFDTDPALSPEERDLNVGVTRDDPAAGPPPFPVITGDLPVPVLSLHDIGDLFVPFSMEQVYAVEAASNGDADLLVTRAIRDVRHCGFAPAELVEGFTDLVAWMEGGPRPAGDDVLDPAAVADRDFGCAFTRPDPAAERAGFRPCGADPVVTPVAAGRDPVASALAVSRAAFDAADAVVVAADGSPADALAAGPLAGRRQAPLLLSPTRRLPGEVADEVRRLGARTAYLVGSPAVLSPVVARDLEALGLEVVRVAGAGRYATAAAVARELGGADRAVIVRGAGTRPLRGVDDDALTAAGLASFLGDPLLFAERVFVPPQTIAALRDLGVRRVTVVGGPDAVSGVAVAQLQAAGVLVERLGGGGAGATSAAVASRSVASGASADRVWVADGADWPTAVTAGPAAAAQGAPLLLAQDGGGDAVEWLRDRRRVLTDVTTAGLSAEAAAAVTDAVTGP